MEEDPRRKKISNVMRINPKKIAALVEEWYDDGIDKELQSKYNAENFFCACEEARLENEWKHQELQQTGHKTKLTYVGGMRCGESTGWSADGHFYMGNTEWHKSWHGIIPKRLHAHMAAVHGGEYWTRLDNQAVKHRKNLVTEWIFGNRGTK